MFWPLAVIISTLFLNTVLQYPLALATVAMDTKPDRAEIIPKLTQALKMNCVNIFLQNGA